jgi:fibronectin type 3 domain-containing protein
VAGVSKSGNHRPDIPDEARLRKGRKVFPKSSRRMIRGQGKRGNIRYRQWLAQHRQPGRGGLEVLEARAYLDNSPAVINIGSGVLAANTLNFGTNIQQAQLNNMTNDPGFEPQILRLSSYATGGGANFIVNDQNDTTSDYGALGDHFFDGATVRVYRVVNGAVTLIRTDTVTSYFASNANGYRMILASNGPTVQAGDVYYLDKTTDNAPNLDVPLDHQLARDGDTWYWLAQNIVSGTGTSRDSSTVAPVNGGSTSMRIDNPGGGEMSIQQFVYGPVDSTYKQLVPGKTYRVSVWLKQSGLASGQVTFKMDNEYSAVNHTFSGVTGNWQQFTYDFVAPAYPVTNAIIQNVLAINGPGTVWADNLLVYDPTYDPFAMQPQALQALQNFKPGTLRIWSGQTNTTFGTTLDNWTNPDSINQLTWDPNYGRTPSPELHLPSALALSKQVGADPWLIVGPYMNEAEWAGLIEYLAGPAGTTYGNKRIAQGHANPWTDDFSDIYIELGNETWNGLFRPWNFPNGTVYGEFAEHFYEAAKASPYYAAIASKVHFTVGGWNLQTNEFGYGASAAKASPSTSVVTQSGYIGNLSGQSSVNDTGFQSLLVAQPDYMYTFADQAVATQQFLATQGIHYQLATYESGPSYDLPNPNQPHDPVQDQYGKSLAAGVGYLDSALYRQQVGFTADNFFLYQPGFNWASTTTLPEGYTPYSSFLALQMRNDFASGDMISSSVSQMPKLTWNSKQLDAVGVYAYRNGNTYSIIVLSRDLFNATPVTLNLPFSSVSSATLHTLTGDPRSDTASIQTQAVGSFSQNFSFSMPAGSIYVFDFDVTPSAPPQPPTGVQLTPGNGQMGLTWTASQGAGTYNIKYGTSPGNYTSTVTGVVGTSKTITGLNNGTTYYFIVTAVNTGGESGPSQEAFGVPALAAPGVPTGVTATAGNGLVNLAWNGVSGATSYNVKYGTTPGVYGAPITGLTGTSTQISGLSNGVTYYFVVSASNAGGQGNNSVEVFATPTNAAPTTSIDFSGGFAGAGSQLTLNGSPFINGSDLQLADNRTSEASTAFANSKQNITNFTTQFDFQITGTWPLGDGFTFIIQNTGLNALGTSGGGLGYQGIGNSVAIKFDVYSNAGEGTNSTGLYTGGASPTVPNSVNLDGTGFNMRSYENSRATISYDGTTLTVVLKDLVSGATATQHYTVNIPALVGGSTAWVGFGAGSGALTSNEVIHNWTYTTTTSAPVAPPVPTGLNAAPGNGQVNLTWDAAAGATSYNVRFGTAPGVYGAPVSVTGTSKSITGLTNGQTYYFVVSAVNGAGESNNSSEVNTTPTAPSPPSAPGGLVATGGNNQVTLSWNAVAGATSYKVYYGTASNNYTLSSGSISGTGTTISGLANGVPYYFVVTASNAAGESSTSAEKSATPVAPAPPVQPTGLHATPGDGQITLTWNSVVNATSYNLKYATTPGGPYTTVNIGGTTKTITGLTNGQTYYFVVSALNTGVEGANSGEINSAPVQPTSGTTIDLSAGFSGQGSQLQLNGNATLFGNDLALTDGGTSQASSVFFKTPQNVAAFTTQFDFQITGNWPLGDGFTFVIQNSTLTALGTGGGGLGYQGINKSVAIKFDVFDNAGEGTNSTGLYTGGAAPTTLGSVNLGGTGFDMRSYDVSRATMTYDGTTLTVTLKDLRTGATATQSYNVNIPALIGGSTAWVGFTAADGALTSIEHILNWTYATVNTTPTPPGAPTGVNVTGGDAQATLSWSPVSGASSYNVRFGTSSGNYGAPISVSGTSKTIPGLANGQTYYFIVSAVNGAGEGGNSAEVFTTPTAPIPQPPSTPTGLQATPGDGQVSLTWGAASGATSYTLKYATVSGGPYTTLQANIAGTSVIAPSLTNGTPYFFVVSASNNNGESSNSSQVSATPAAAPVNTVNFAGGFSGAAGSLFLNGNAFINVNALQLLNGAQNQVSSVFANTKQNIASFSTTFDFQMTGNWPIGDGFTFVIQNAGSNALGVFGGGLGYKGIGNSVAIKFDIFDNAGEGNNSTGLYINGVPPENAGSVNLDGTGFNMRSYDLSRATISYDGTTLTVILKDLLTGATATQQYAVNIPSIVGSNLAYVGFTAGDGALTSNIQIKNWVF